MGERVETGGLMSFDYSKAERSKLNKEQKENIERGYAEYYNRKEREKRKKFFIILLIIILIVAGILALVI